MKNKKETEKTKTFTEKRNRSLSRQRKTFYRILGRAAPLTFKFFTDSIEKIIKTFQD